MKKFLFVAIVSCILSSSLFAQSVAINSSGATANASSILDVQSTTKGMLIPRMTKAQKNAIASPATGLLVYQAVPDSVGFHYYSGSQWIWLNPAGAASNDWSITGNTGTDTAVNFIGTTDNMPLAFRVNNESSGRIESSLATANTFLGNRSGRFNTGVGNTAFGFRTLAAAGNGSNNTAIGTSALNANTSGLSNTAIGSSAMLNNTSGGGNVAIGNLAMLNNTSGTVNIGIGSSALQSNTLGNENIALGLAALGANTLGNLNVAIGNNVMAANITGAANTAIGGYQTMFKNISGQSNVAIGGWQNMFNNTHGSNNVSIGGGLGGSVSGLYSNTTGSYNIAIGGGLYGNTTGSYNIALGGYALYQNGDKSNNIAIGQSALSNNGSDAPLAFQAINNIGIGNAALLNNKKGSNNVALGSSAAYLDTSQFYNVAIGNYAMGESTGDRNVAVGSSALLKNTGNSNVAVGDSAAANLNVSGTVAIGAKAMLKNITGIQNTAVGFEAMQNNTNGNYNTIVGYGAFSNAVTGGDNTVVGASALANATSLSSGNAVLGSLALLHRNAQTTVAIGSYAGYKSNAPINTVTGCVYIGNSAGGNSVGDNNTYIGDQSGNTTIGNNNLFLGTNAGNGLNGGSNTILGSGAGIGSTGNSNVFIGTSVGASAVGNGLLMIDNSSTPTPLIYGNFISNLLQVNGTLSIGGQYNFPTSDGGVNQVLYTNGAGNLGWANAVANANNGLTVTGSNVTLGGTLLNNTTVTQGNNNMNFDLTGTGDFRVKTSLINALSVSSNGSVGINTNAPQYKLHVLNTVGGSGPFGSGIMVQNNNNITTGEASISFKNSGPDGLPSNRSWMTGMNNFTNYVIAYGDSLKTANVKLRVDTTGNVVINPNSPAATYLDVNGDFATRLNIVPVNNGMNNDVDPGRFSFIKVTTATSAFSLSGFAGGVDGKILTVVNLSGNNMTIVNQGTSASATANRINTLTGADIVTTGNGSITMQYSNPDNRWIVIAVRD